MQTHGRERLLSPLFVAVAVCQLLGSSQVDLASAASTDVVDLHIGTGPVAVMLADRAAGAGGATFPVLAFEGVEGRSVQPIRINVFVGGADRRTATAGPRFVGAIQLLPNNGRVRSSGFTFDLSDVPKASADGGLDLTLVPVIGTDSEPRDVDLRVARITIRREPL